jgi:hypothetical protein
MRLSLTRSSAGVSPGFKYFTRLFTEKRALQASEIAFRFYHFYLKMLEFGFGAMHRVKCTRFGPI